MHKQRLVTGSVVYVTTFFLEGVGLPLGTLTPSKKNSTSIRKTGKTKKS